MATRTPNLVEHRTEGLSYYSYAHAYQSYSRPVPVFFVVTLALVYMVLEI